MTLPRHALLAMVAWWTFTPSAWAGYRLRCEVTYAGESQTITAVPVTDMYRVPSVDIAGRFRFKPVLVGAADAAPRVALYVYADTPRQPVLVQHAAYPPPTPPTPPLAPGQAHDLTGLQRLYAGPQERELIYQCTLHHDAPGGQP